MQKFLPVLLMLALFAGCQKNDHHSDQSTSIPALNSLSLVTDPKVLGYFSKLGFNTKEIYEGDTFYLVDGDISFGKNDVQKKIRNKDLSTETHSYERLIAANNIYVRNLITGTPYDLAVREAIKAWNSVTNCKLNLIYTNGTAPVPIDITVVAGPLGLRTCGYGTFPDANGRAGHTITIDLDITQSLNQSQLNFLLTHEFGHNLGLRHSEFLDPDNAIPGSPEYDPTSVMKSRTCGFNWNGLAASDIQAIQYLYPGYAQTFVTQIFGPAQAPEYSTVTHTSGAFYACGKYEWRLLNTDEQIIGYFPGNCSELTWGGYPAGEYYIECRLVNPEGAATTPWNRHAFYFL